MANIEFQGVSPAVLARDYVPKPAAGDPVGASPIKKYDGTTVWIQAQKMNLRAEVTPSGTDDTAAVNTALAAFDAAGGGVLRVPRDNWKFTGSTGLALINTANPIHVEAEPGCTFDMTGVTASVGILLGGSLGASAALGADAAVDAETITCALTVSPGDIIQILSTVVWSPVMSASRKGELAEVLSASGGVITLRSGLRDTYTAATTTVTLMQAPRVSVEGLTFFRNSNDAGLRVMYARDMVLGNLYAEGARERLFDVQYVFGAITDNLKGRDFWYSGSGTSYGLCIASSQHVQEIGNHLLGGRHAVSHGGVFPVRDVQIVGGTFDNEHQAPNQCFDFHPNVEGVRMVGATMLNMMIVQASNFDGSDLTVRIKSTSASGAGVELDLTRTCEYLKLRDCDIQVAAAANCDGVWITNRSGATATSVRLVQVSGTVAAGSSSVGVRVSPATSADTGGTIERLEIGGDVRGVNAVKHAKQGGTGPEITVLTVHASGRLAGTTGDGVSVSAVNTLRWAYLGATVECANAKAAHTGASVGAMDVLIRGSRLAAPGGSGDQNYFGTGRLEMQDSVLDGFGANGGVSAASASEALIDNVRRLNCTGTMALPARHYAQVNARGNVVTDGTVAPTAGTWAVGDRCLNTAPAVAGSAGSQYITESWVCTVAGTPGTWVETRTLTGT